MAVKNQKAKKTWGWIAIIAMILLALLLIYANTGIGGSTGAMELLGKTGFYICIGLLVTLAIVAIIMNPDFLDVLVDTIGKAGDKVIDWAKQALNVVVDSGGNLLEKLAFPLIVGGLAFFTVSKLLEGGSSAD